VCEIERIAKEFERLRSRGGAAVLATIVGTRGSTYRRAGARMLIGDDGSVTGSLSGGCLERDVILRARQVMAGGEPVVARYDSTSDDPEEGYSVGCNGLVEILVERLDQGTELMDFLGACVRQRRIGVVATILGVDRVAARRGGHLLLRAGEPPRVCGIEDPLLLQRIGAAAAEALATRRRSAGIHAGERGHAAVFVDVVMPPPKLVVCGGGHDAVPLVALARAQGWHVSVVDRRPGHAMRTRFPEADVLASDLAAMAPTLDHDAAAVVMHHNYFEDLAALEVLLSSPARYVGVLGPRRRTDRLLRDLADRGFSLTDAQKSRLYAPAGLDIGADTPAEVALSILAESKAVMAGRRGGLCRERKGPLHELSSGTLPISAATRPTSGGPL
jgi:xanthine/CO dehydrogenase XdhC/CoxF family maturation factor